MSVEFSLSASIIAFAVGLFGAAFFVLDAMDEDGTIPLVQESRLLGMAGFFSLGAVATLIAMRRGDASNWPLLPGVLGLNLMVVGCLALNRFVIRRAVLRPKWVLRIAAAVLGSGFAATVGPIAFLTVMTFRP